MIKEKDFIQKFEEIRSWIRRSVDAFGDDSEEIRARRLKKAESDKIYFAQTYFPHYVEDNFAAIHKEMFKICDVYNKPIVVAGAREIAKSTVMSFFDELHKTLFKKNRFTVFICDTQETAISEFLLPIKAELEENQRIIADFGNQKTGYWALDDFITKSGKRFLALGPRMGAKGKHFGSTRVDRIMVEDMENINSPRKKSIIKRRLKWISKDVLKSVNSKKWQFFFIGNYFSKKTMIHYMLTADEFAHWERHIFPAMREVNGKLKSVWEERLSTKALLEEQRQDSVTFRTERMQKPEDEEAIFKVEWIKYFEYEEIADKNLPVVTFTDPSAQSGEEHCYKATIALAVDKENARYYVLEAWIKKTSKWNAVYKHVQLSMNYKSAFDGIESNGFQSTLKEDYEIVEEKLGQRLNLKLINSRLPKNVRISRLSSPIERGFICFRRNHSDQNELVEQLIDFPDGDFVDGPDALEGAVNLADTYVLKKTNKIKATIL